MGKNDWRNNIDEMVLGLGVVVVAIVAILFAPDNAATIAVPCVTALGAYIAGKNNKSDKPK